MEQTIKDRFNDDILATAAGRYGVALEGLQSLGGFESYIYAFERGGKGYILRIGHSRRRSVNLIAAEVDWMNYLAAGGAAVAAAIPSQNGQLVELIEDGFGDHFLATAFVKAPGGPPGKAVWNETLFTAWGQAIGQMHALTKAYRPSNPAFQRPHWDSPDMLDIDGLLPDSETDVLAVGQALTAELRRLPQSRDTYGLVHQDAHGGNFFVDEAGRLTFFDFDDSAYTWFANDIAIVLFYAVSARPNPVEFGRTFITDFMKGYGRENQLPAGWWQDIPRFLKLREIQLYAIIHRSFDVTDLDDDPWIKWFMEGRQARIVAGVPYLDMDFRFLAG